MIQSFLRYGLIGAMATAVHYAVLICCVEWAHVPAAAGAGIGAVAGAQMAFIGNRHFTFTHRGPWGRAWLKFQGAAGLGALVSVTVVAAAVRCGWHYLVAQGLATAIALVLTFAINRAWTFR